MLVVQLCLKVVVHFIPWKVSVKKPDTPPCTASSIESENFKCLVQHKVKAAAETSVAAVCER